MSQGQNVTVDVNIGSKCHSGRSPYIRVSFKSVAILLVLFKVKNILTH